MNRNGHPCLKHRIPMPARITEQNAACTHGTAAPLAGGASPSLPPEDKWTSADIAMSALMSRNLPVEMPEKGGFHIHPGTADSLLLPDEADAGGFIERASDWLMLAAMLMLVGLLAVASVHVGIAVWRAAGPADPVTWGMGQ